MVLLAAGVGSQQDLECEPGAQKWALTLQKRTVALLTEVGAKASRRHCLVIGRRLTRMDQAAKTVRKSACTQDESSCIYKNAVAVGSVVDRLTGPRSICKAVVE